MRSSSGVTRCRPLLGTFVEITAAGPAVAAHRAIDRAFRAVERVHRLMSFHDPESDVSRINRAGRRDAVRVHAQTWRVLERAQSLAEATRGLFDVTVAAQLVRWRF